jgi:hypothetical protein
MLTFEDISNDLLGLVFSGLNLSLVETLAWKPLTLIVQLIKYVQLAITKHFRTLISLKKVCPPGKNY